MMDKIANLIWNLRAFLFFSDTILQPFIQEIMLFLCSLKTFWGAYSSCVVCPYVYPAFVSGQ